MDCVGIKGPMDEFRIKEKQFKCCCIDQEDLPIKMGSCFADCIAKASHSQYVSLPKTGKPQSDKEWTLLSSIIQVTQSLG